MIQRLPPLLDYLRWGSVGLGLSIVQWIVQGHKGEIHVESAIGQGSTFEVWLPLQAEGK